MQSLSEIGELRIVEILQRALGSSSRTVVGFGDDVSVVKLSRGMLAVLKTDMLVGSTDVPPGMTFRQVAWKAAVGNVSDFAAKGVRPFAGLVALGLPADLTKSDVRQIASGLQDASRTYRFPFVGGDTNESKDLTVSIALLGLIHRNRLVLRRGARDGDMIAVTGEFGSSAAGMKALLDYGVKPAHLPPGLSDAVYHPRAELQIGLRLAKSDAATSSIDSSDGLAWSLHHLSSASGVGMLVQKLPISKEALKFAGAHGVDAVDLALYGGEEYHLVLTIDPIRFDSAVQAAGGKLRAIGVVTRRFRGVRMRDGGGERSVIRRGWEHFRRHNQN